jgi:hypothetical protein
MCCRKLSSGSCCQSLSKCQYQTTRVCSVGAFWVLEEVNVGVLCMTPMSLVHWYYMNRQNSALMTSWRWICEWILFSWAWHQLQKVCQEVYSVMITWTTSILTEFIFEMQTYLAECGYAWQVWTSYNFSEQFSSGSVFLFSVFGSWLNIMWGLISQMSDCASGEWCHIIR